MNSIRLAYLVSRYPAVSHTFILREIQVLRSLGLEIQIASINSPDRKPEDMTATEQQEVENTLYVKSAGLGGALTASIVTLITNPLGFMRGLWFSWRLGGGDIGKIIYASFYFIEALIIARWMRAQGLNHIHVHFATQAATVAMILERTFGIEYSITVHGPDEFYHVKEQYLARKIIHAKFICCISNFARSQLMLLSDPQYWHKFIVAPLGVNPQIFQPVEFRQNPQPLQILCVGRLVPVKGQHILLQAVQKLLAEGRNIKLCYVGDGPDRASLEQAAKPLGAAVYFAGAVNQEQILTFYQQADLFVLASFAEGVPVVLMEAMVMQIACITTHITGIPELIKSGESLLVAPSDIEGLAQAIASLIDNPQLRYELAQNGRQAVLQRYELQTNTTKLANIFQNYLQ
jgi:colanic acid/amylovoran biosynthesis glycosyltransferase